MPFGIAPAPEEFQRRLNEALEGLDGVRTIADDIIFFGVGDTDEEAVVDHDRKLVHVALLERCRQRHIKLNKDKIKFKLPQLSYVGHVISAEGLKSRLRQYKTCHHLLTSKAFEELWEW